MISPQPGNLWSSTLLHIYSRPPCPANLIMGNDQFFKEGNRSGSLSSRRPENSISATTFVTFPLLKRGKLRGISFLHGSKDLLCYGIQLQQNLSVGVA